MSLVTGDDRPRRVGPQVFADVPSQSKINAIRSNRNTFATMLVLALGALALAVAGLLYFANQASEMPQLRIDHAKALELKDERIGELTTQLQGYEGITEIVELRSRAAADRKAIEDRIAQDSGASTVIPANSWFTRERGTGRWPVLRQGLEEGLRQEINGGGAGNNPQGLAETRRRVEAYRPAGNAPLPVNP